MKTKKIPSIAEQAAAGAASMAKWAKGETRLSTTFATRDGARTTARMTRDEMEARLEELAQAKKAKAQAFKEIRADLELSQPKFAHLLHAGSAAVKQWEAGRRAIPPPVLALAEIARDFPAVRARLEATASQQFARPESASTGMVGRGQGTRKRAAHG